MWVVLIRYQNVVRRFKICAWTEDILKDVDSLHYYKERKIVQISKYTALLLI